MLPSRNIRASIYFFSFVLMTALLSMAATPQKNEVVPAKVVQPKEIRGILEFDKRFSKDQVIEAAQLLTTHLKRIKTAFVRQNGPYQYGVELSYETEGKEKELQTFIKVVNAILDKKYGDKTLESWDLSTNITWVKGQ